MVRNSKQPCAPSCHTYGNITFKAANGTIRDIKQDCILYLWESTAFRNAKGRPDEHVLLKEIDESDRFKLFKEMFPQGRFTNETVRTFECRKLDYKDVIHAPYEDNPSGKQKAVANLLKFAITLKKKSVGLYFDDANPFLKGGDFMTHVATALLDISSFARYPIEVVVFVGKNFFNRAISFFKENIQIDSGAQTVVMTLAGTKSNLTAAVDYLRKEKEVILIKLHMPQEDQVDAIAEPASLNAPGEMFIERGTDSRDMQFSSTYVQNPELERMKELECYMEMKNIPMSETKESLKLKLVDLELPIIFPKLVYQDGSDTAILICKNVEDAKKLENVQKSEFIFKGYDGKKCYTKVSWNFPKAKDLQPEDMDELKKIYVNVDEATGKIETLTTYQLKCAKVILAKYDKQKGTQTEEGINENELVTINKSIEMEASEDVWNIVSEICKKDIKSFEKNFGPVKFENSKIVIPAHDRDFAKSEVQKTDINKTKYLSHGGGVAAVIARAAGYNLIKEGNDYIARNGDIPSWSGYCTTAGKLNYKCVIHTVGPSWYDYESRSHDDVQRCKNDLFHAHLQLFFLRTLLKAWN
ncbi:uncharacterized protein LOC132740418 [Ruditapes philippinarum]|uniref:uncharacterized protein LOC132740418 n=1 Tax=Ruditapes philippinarum TaxID=129788 RepID=UPI00295BB894|nr:uncharacterized protein LOC132740418 [Ruditapes philippinarum]